METTKQITGVKVIMNIAKPIIVFQLAGHPDVARNPKQALTDLQNSGRALGITSTSDPRFVKEVHGCVGATLSGDLRVFKAGDEYTIGEGHPAIVDRNHPQFGKVNLGDKLRAEADGVWVEGFLSIPQTLMERQLEANAGAYASVMMAFMGFGAPVANVAATPASETFVPEAEQPDKELAAAAIGNKATPEKK
jgi:hypothetical protein